VRYTPAEPTKRVSLVQTGTFKDATLPVQLAALGHRYNSEAEVRHFMLR
jgi:hypothetical protein